MGGITTKHKAKILAVKQKFQLQLLALRRHVTEEDGSSTNAIDVCSEGSRFTSWPRHRIS
jgi:hypothetical protein